MDWMIAYLLAGLLLWLGMAAEDKGWSRADGGKPNHPDHARNSLGW